MHHHELTPVGLNNSTDAMGAVTFVVEFVKQLLSTPCGRNVVGPK